MTNLRLYSSVLPTKVYYGHVPWGPRRATKKLKSNSSRMKLCYTNLTPILMTLVNLNRESLFPILKVLQQYHQLKIQGRKRGSEELHHRDTNFIPVVLFGGFEKAYKIITKRPILTSFYDHIQVFCVSL